ncbi:GNAT family N-acetyltransferase [Sphingomonas morindae]|uniref:GNAT family N-acetyltransferase n=1 Tax=Sphingomonas morindae TaxID=1541170 RepID=A0ABY4X6T9_9SPHN|nr:GNAT family N-acetyltransferase [Sphingomonas morindae]USI72627.1 GNAT family N-acetyltransferase [Sphingomonas morindae]
MLVRPARDARPDLGTARLRLRRPVRADASAIVRIAGTWEVARGLARVPHPYAVADAHVFLERIVPQEWLWAMTLPPDDALIGVIGLAPAPTPGAAELGYWLAPAHWGQGLATEAARAVLAHGRTGFGLSQFSAHYFEDNPASGRVLHKLGFVETGRILRPCLARGAAQPSIRMALPAPA